VRVQVEHPDAATDGLLLCWCDLDLRDGGIEAGETEEPCDARSKFTPTGAAGRCTAVRINIERIRRLLQREDIRIRVLIDGDFIRGEYDGDPKLLRALDADHLPRNDAPLPQTPQPGVDPEWLQMGDKRSSGDGIEGGLFVSWFSLRRG
jgi:hypothetical protein